MSPSKAPNQLALSGHLAIIGSGVGFAAYIASVAIVMGCVPRHPEGTRQVVSLPWPLYVTLPGVLAFLPMIAAGMTISRRKWSLAFIVGFTLAIAFCQTSTSELLRRDYIGKF